MLQTLQVTGSHRSRGVVVRRQEGGEGLALVQPVRAATEDEPFAVVLCPGEGLHTGMLRASLPPGYICALRKALGFTPAWDQQGRGEQDRRSVHGVRELPRKWGPESPAGT